MVLPCPRAAQKGVCYTRGRTRVVSWLVTVAKWFVRREAARLDTDKACLRPVGRGLCVAQILWHTVVGKIRGTSGLVASGPPCYLPVLPICHT